MNPQGLSKEFLETVYANKVKLDKGIPTLVPFPFPRLASIIPGIEPGAQVIITGQTGSGKSRVARALFVKNTMKFASDNGIEVKIFINSLEETKVKVVSTLISSYIYRKYGIKMDYYKILNYQAKKGLSIIEMGLVEEGAEWVNTHYSCLNIEHISTPRLYYNKVMEYMSTIGDFLVEDSSGGLTKVDYKQKFDKFVYSRPVLVISIFDTIDKCTPSLVHGEKSTYEAAKNYSAVLSRQRMCMKCGVISVIVQQQDPLSERVETTTGGKRLIEKAKPNLSFLRTCKATQEDASLILGVFNPVKVGETSYLGYSDVTKLVEGKFRSVSILKTREGTPEYPNNELPLCCKFSIDEIEELPLPTDIAGMKKYFTT